MRLRSRWRARLGRRCLCAEYQERRALFEARRRWAQSGWLASRVELAGIICTGAATTLAALRQTWLGILLAGLAASATICLHILRELTGRALEHIERVGFCWNRIYPWLPPAAGAAEPHGFGVKPCHGPQVEICKEKGCRPYQLREIDALLDRSLKSPDPQRQFVAVCGDPGTGKSRSALEAARRFGAAHRVVAPRKSPRLDFPALTELASADPCLCPGTPVIIWLDELERYLDDGTGTGGFTERMLDRLHAASPESRVVATARRKPEPDPEQVGGLVEQLRILDVLDRGDWLTLDGPPKDASDRGSTAAEPSGRLDRLRVDDPDAYEVLHAVYLCQAVLQLQGRTKDVIRLLAEPEHSSAANATGLEHFLERLLRPRDGGTPLLVVDHHSCTALYSLPDDVQACFQKRASP